MNYWDCVPESLSHWRIVTLGRRLNKRVTHGVLNSERLLALLMAQRHHLQRQQQCQEQ